MEAERYKMIYKINKNLYNNIKLNNKIRIFGHNFVKNNKNKAKLIINNKKYKLEEYINNDNIKEYKCDKLKIAILLNKKLSNFGHIFENCTGLIEFLYNDNIINSDDIELKELEKFDDYNIDFNENNSIEIDKIPQSISELNEPIYVNNSGINKYQKICGGESFSKIFSIKDNSIILKKNIILFLI